MHVVVPSPTILLVSSDACVVRLLESVSTLVSRFSFEVCSDFPAVTRLIAQRNVVLVLIHIRADTDQTAVKELLCEVTHGDRPVATVLLMDEFDEKKKTELLRAGAACCLPGDVSIQKLAHTLDSLTFWSRSAEALPDEQEPSSVELANLDPSFYVLSPEIMQMMDQVRHVVPKNTPILFTGETGTGKTRTARLIHEMSPRCEQPFVVIDCSSLSPSLIESELFGHVKGAFTGADRERPGKLSAAGKGTLVLDEINSLPLSLQCKLLRVMDDRVFEPVGSNQCQPLEARLITISNASLDQEVAAGRFRADLYYRLNVVGFHLLPLRERVNAIGPLAQKFVAQFAANNESKKIGITADALRALERYHWPGNIRELGNVIERATTLFPGPTVQLDHLPEALRANDARVLLSIRDVGKEAGAFLGQSKMAASQDLTLMKTKEKAEIWRITEALHKHRNNRLRAAAELGISRMALYKKLHKYGLHNTG